MDGPPPPRPSYSTWKDDINGWKHYRDRFVGEEQYYRELLGGESSTSLPKPNVDLDFDFDVVVDDDKHSHGPEYEAQSPDMGPHNLGFHPKQNTSPEIPQHRGQVTARAAMLEAIKRGESPVNPESFRPPGLIVSFAPALGGSKYLDQDSQSTEESTKKSDHSKKNRTPRMARQGSLGNNDGETEIFRPPGLIVSFAPALGGSKYLDQDSQSTEESKKKSDHSTKNRTPRMARQGSLGNNYGETEHSTKKRAPRMARQASLGQSDDGAEYTTNKRTPRLARQGSLGKKEEGNEHPAKTRTPRIMRLGWEGARKEPRPSKARKAKLSNNIGRFKTKGKESKRTAKKIDPKSIASKLGTIGSRRPSRATNDKKKKQSERYKKKFERETPVKHFDPDGMLRKMDPKEAAKRISAAMVLRNEDQDVIANHGQLEQLETLVERFQNLLQNETLSMERRLRVADVLVQLMDKKASIHMKVGLDLLSSFGDQ